MILLSLWSKSFLDLSSNDNSSDFFLSILVDSDIFSTIKLYIIESGSISKAKSLAVFLN